MATKSKTTGNKRKTIKELQYHCDCYQKSIRNQKIVMIILVLIIILQLISPYFY